MEAAVTTSAKVILDSISPAGIRLTSIELSMPRSILAQFNTHRVFSRSAESTRAVPLQKRMAAVLDRPFVPEAFGKNRKGMQATELLDASDDIAARAAWIQGSIHAVNVAQSLANLKVHKQQAGRLLEPFAYVRVLVTATEWDNFRNLRVHHAADPEMQKLAACIRDALAESAPWPRTHHLPYLREGETDVNLSVARCARVSYDRLGDATTDDAHLAHTLRQAGHMGPFEHQAVPFSDMHWSIVREMQRVIRESALPVLQRQQLHDQTEFLGNFRGWVQTRKTIPGEGVFVG